MSSVFGVDASKEREGEQDEEMDLRRQPYSHHRP